MTRDEERAREIVMQPIPYVRHVVGCGCDHERMDPDCPATQGRIALIAQALVRARREENEACARIADDEMAWSERREDSDIRAGQVGASSRIAAAIRARQTSGQGEGE